MVAMAVAKRNWIGTLAGSTLCLSVCAAAFAQPDPNRSTPPHSIQIQSPLSGSLSGKLTDLHSAPLGGMEIVLRNQATGAATRMTTAKNGGFRFTSLGVGEYTLEANEPGLGRGLLDGIVISGGIESRLQAAMHFERDAPTALADAQPIQSNPPTRAGSPQPADLLTRNTLPIRSTMSVLFGTPSSARAQLTVLALSSIDESLRIELPTPAHAFALPAFDLPQIQPAPLPTQLPLRPAINGQILEPRAQLETESAILEPLSASFRPLRGFSLRARVEPSMILAAAAAGSIREAMLNNLSHLGPIVTASQKHEPDAPAITATIDAAQLQALPVSGRRWQQFLLNTQAASASADSSPTSSHGETAQSAEITVDGASLQLAFGVAAGSEATGSAGHGQRSSMSPAWAGGRGPGVSEAAIRQVEATAGNVEAESMRAVGGRTVIQTQGGTDSPHGQGFLFDRQNTWGARNPFTQWVQNVGTVSAPNFAAKPFTPPDHEMVGGLGIGGSIRRDKLFWFAAIDSKQRNDPGLSMVKNPAQFFNLPEPTSPSVTLLSAQLGETQSQAYNDYLGVPASGHAPAGLEQLAGLLGPAPRSSAQWVGFGRTDWQIAERHRLTLEGTGASWSAAGGGLSRVSENDGNHSYGSSQAIQRWLLARWEAYVTPNLLAITQASARYEQQSARPETPSAFEQTFLNGDRWGQLPQIVVDSRYGFTIGNPSRFGQGSYPDEHLYHAQEMLDWVHGKLLVKSGFEIDHNADATSMLRNQTGTYVYSNITSFISDALAFEKFGLADALDAANPHNCGATKTEFGSQPCYSYFSQTLGPTDWHLSTNDWASYATAQWQVSKRAVFSAGLRWELEQMPPPIAALANPALPQTGKLSALGSNWGPRISLAIGQARSHWPVLRMGYGMYYGRTENAVIETVLTQTGSLRGDLHFFMRPSDDCQRCAGGAPPFPYVLAGQPANAVKPGAVEFAPNFRNPEVHQAVVAVEENLPGRIELSASAMLSLGRRLPISIDTNFDPAVNPGTITYAVDDPTGKGPIKATRINVPFYASWPSSSEPSQSCTQDSPSNFAGPLGWCNPNYQQVSQIISRANSTYEAAMVRVVRNGRRGLNLRVNYTYAHAMDWNPNESTLVAGSDVLDPANFGEEYGVSNLDVRHSAAATAILEPPWKLHNFAGRLANGWMLSGIGQFHSGLPYTMRTSDSIPEEFTVSGAAIAGLGPGINGSGGDNRVYGLGSDGHFYNVGRNTFRYPDTWKADLRLAKRFDLGEMRQLELLAESFNLFNHRNVTELESSGYAIESGGASGALPTLCYLTMNAAGNARCPSTSAAGGTLLPAFGQPLNVNGTNFYRERQIQLGLRMRF